MHVVLLFVGPFLKISLVTFYVIPTGIPCNMLHYSSVHYTWYTCTQVNNVTCT